MDADHRHELRQNDLAEFIAHIGQWWDKHGIKTLVIVLLVAGAVFIYRLHRTTTDQAHDTVWFDLSQATSAQQYRGVAAAQEGPAVQALAYLRAGDLTLRKAMEPDPFADDEGNDPQAWQNKQLDAAEQDYNAVLDSPVAHLAIRLNAMLGLAAVAESRQQFDDARKIYQQIQDQTTQGYENIAQIASKREAVLDRAAKPVIFAPEDPKPLPTDQTPILLPAGDSTSQDQGDATSDSGDGSTSAADEPAPDDK